MAGDIVDRELLPMPEAGNGMLFISDADARDVWLTQSAHGCGLQSTVGIAGQHLRRVAAFLIRAAERREAQAAAASAPAECTAIASDEELPPADILTTTGVI